MNGGAAFPRSGVALAIVAALVVACGGHERIGDYDSVSSLGRAGFSRSRDDLRGAEGRHVKVWGYVDHHNLYAHDAQGILGEWWSGAGPTPTTWRFDLKAEPGGPAGRSIPVHAPNDAGRDALLRVFAADAGAGRPTRVFVDGTLHTFDAPTNFRRLVGLTIVVRSSSAVRRNHTDVP